MRPRLVALVTVVALAAACGRDVLAPTAPSQLVPAGGRLILSSEAPDLSAFGWTTSNTGILASLSIDPSVFLGGESTGGTVTLHDAAPAGGLRIALSSDDTAATVPASVTIAQGATSGTFAITTRSVPADVTIRIIASVGTSSLTALMRITPVVAVKSLAVEHTRITGGLGTTATVTLTAVNTSGSTVVGLESERSGDVRVPSSITIGSGSTNGTFTVDTRDISAEEETWIHARVGRTTRQSVQVRVVPSRSGGTSGLTIRAIID